MILQVSVQGIISLGKQLEDLPKLNCLSPTEVPVCRHNPSRKYKQEFTLKVIRCEWRYDGKGI